MKFFKKAGLFLTSVLTFGISAVSAQDSQNIHQTMHNKLLADQVNIYKEMNLLDSLKTLSQLKQEDILYPADNIYNSWNTEWVNPYRNSVSLIPDSLRIDVSEYTAPIMGKVTSNYGWRRRRMHNGIDLKLSVGDTVRAAFSGKIRVRKYERGGYGYYLVVRHNNGLETVYGHLSKFLVQVDDVVRAGEPIALGGNTGRSTGPHLHFETRLLGMAINPADIIDFNNYVAHTDTYMFYAHGAKKYTPGISKKATSVASSHGSNYHKVRRGDTLYAIARKYHISVKELCRLNNIKTTTTLRLGQRLRCS